MRLKELCLSLFSFITFIAVNGQLYKPQFKALTKEEGLSSNQITYIYPDENNVIWIGTQDGLNLFDGTNLKVFKNKKNDSTSIRSNTITTILSSPNKNELLIGCANGLDIYDKSKNRFKRLKVKSKVKGKGKDKKPFVFDRAWINSMSFDSDNKLYVVTRRRGLFIFSPDLKSFKRFERKRENGNSSFAMFSHIIDSKGRLIVSTIKGIEILDPATGEFKTMFTTTYPELKDSKVSKIYEDSQGNLWFLSNVLGVVFCENGDFDGELKFYNKTNGYLLNNIPGDIVEDSKGIYLIADRNGGLIELNIETDKTNYYVPDIHDEFSLKTKAVTIITKDKLNNIWLGGFMGGACYVDRSRKQFEHFKVNFRQDGIFNNTIRALFQSSNGEIWVGTKEGGGISKFDPKNGTFENYPYDPNKDNRLSSDYVFAIGEYDNRFLTIGSLGKGMDVFDRKTGVFVNYPPGKTQDSIKGKGIGCFYKHTNGKLYIASSAGLEIFDPATKTFDIHKNVRAVKHMLYESGNLIWIASHVSGLSLYDIEKGKFIKNYNPRTKIKAHKIATTRINQVAKDGNGTIWAASDNEGVYGIKSDSTTIIRVTEKNGLSGNSVAAIQVDGHGNIWASTENGLSKINRKTHKVRNYTRFDGLQGSEFERYVGLKINDGRMIFGGRNGFNFFHPDSIKENLTPPNVIFTDFKLFNESVKIGAPGSPLKNHINYTKTIKLNHKQNIISISFVAVNFSTPEKNTYKYIMEGFDKKWVNAGNRTTAEYTNLPAGDYNFKVMGANNDGVWCTEPAIVKIKAKPAFWNTWLFRIAVFLLLAYGVYRFYRARVNRMKQQQAMLQAKIKEGELIVDEKVQELEVQKEEIRIRDEREKEMRYVNKGSALLGNIISKDHDNLESLSQALISGIIDYTTAVQGVIYVLIDDFQGAQTLEIKGKYGVDLDKLGSGKIDVGEGYPGTCFKRKEVLEVEDLPESYSKINSGLGEIVPKFLLFIPLKQNNRVNGIIEVASFEKMEKYQVDFLCSIGESVYSAINTFVINERISSALEKSKFQTEELQAQEEELRQNLEEVNATKEEMQRQVDANDQLSAELDKYRSALRILLSEEGGAFICIKDKEGMILEMSKATHPFLPNINKKELIGKSENTYLSKQSAQELTRINKDILKFKKPVRSLKISVTDKKGNKVETKISIHPIVAENKSVLGTVCIID